MFHEDLTSRKLNCTFGFALWLTLFTLCVAIYPRQSVHAAENSDGKIVFSLGEMLWTMNLDGSDRQALGIEGETPKWSPDGSQIVFVRRYRDINHQSYSHIYLVNTNGTNLRRLTYPLMPFVPGVITPFSKNVFDPVWAPDGKQIAYSGKGIAASWDRDPKSDIYVTDIFGEYFRFPNLTDSADTSEIAPAWSPDGQQIAYLSEGHLVTIDLEDKHKTALTDKERHLGGLIWSPDGIQLAFAAMTREVPVNDLGFNVDIYVMDVESKVETRLTTHPAIDRAPAWSPDGAQIVFESDRDGVDQLYRLTIESREVVQLTHSGFPARSPDWMRGGKSTKSDPSTKNARNKIIFYSKSGLSTMNPDGSDWQNLDIEGGEAHLSPDGTQIVFTFRYSTTGHNSYSRIFVADADGNNPRLLTVPPRWVRHEGPVWSPDGQRIAFYSTYTNNDIYVIDVSGENLINLTNSLNTNNRSPAWSPDGQRIAFHSYPKDKRGNPVGDYDIYVINVSGENLINLTDSPNTNESNPSWSPDGKKIAYLSDGHLYTIHLADRRKTRLTTKAGVGGAVWSSDGTRLAYSASRQESDGGYNQDIYVMDIENQVETRLTTHPASDRLWSWLADGTQILFYSDRNEDGYSDLYRITIVSGTIEQLTDDP